MGVRRPDEPMVPGRLLGVEDPETGGVTVRCLVEDADGHRFLRAVAEVWSAM